MEGGGDPKGKSAPLKLPDIRIFMVGPARCSSAHYSVAVPMVHRQINSDQSISLNTYKNPCSLTFRAIVFV